MPSRIFAVLVAVASTASTALASDTAPSVEERLARAERFSADKLRNAVLNGAVRPQWLPDGERFWFQKQSARGHEFVLVQAATGKQRAAFDHQALAAALNDAGARGLSADSLPITSLSFSSRTLEVQLDQPPADIGMAGAMLLTREYVRRLATATYRCDASLSRCERIEGNRSQLATGEMASFAPAREKSVYMRDHNLWLRAGEGAVADRQLTRDGVAHFAYGAWDEEIHDLTYIARRRTGTSLGPNWVQWSPDGRYLATMRVDLRNTPERLLFAEHVSGKDRFTVPSMRRFPVPADNVTLTRVVEVFDTQSGSSAQAQIDPARLQDWAVSYFQNNRLWWNLSDKVLHVVTGSRDGRRYGLVAVDIESGRTRTIVEETERQHYVSTGGNSFGTPNFHVTANGAEAIWYSQRSGFGHLYLYDARSGTLKNPITQGDWVVFEIVRVDDARRMIYFTAGGKETGANPYYASLYRVGFDGGKVDRLTPENAHHDVSFSNDGRFFVDTYSTVLQAPVTVIRRADGRIVKELLRADTSRLDEMGWRPPAPFTVKAADGKTDLYGVMYRPTSFDSGKKYPVVELTYPGPQNRYAPRSFMEAVVTMSTSLQSVADLGFVSVFLDGRGTAGRDREFRYVFIGTDDPFGAADHKAAIENLARQHTFIDATRVGVIGGSYGGYGGARAALLFPDFFDVCVSSAGPHDWRYAGFPYAVEHLFGLQKDSEGGDYRTINNTSLVNRLKGKMLLLYGEVDENLPLNHAFVMADALIKAGKDYDMLIVPNADHSVSSVPYVRSRWQRYFVEHLGEPVDQ